MKSFTKLSLGLLAAAASLTGTASAQTIVHLVGSTAFRSPATAAIIDTLSNGGTATVRAGYSSGSLLGASQAIIANGTIGSGGTATIIVETYFTGSLAGCVDVAVGNNTGSYIDPSGLTSAAINSINTTAVTTSPYGGGAAVSYTATTAAPDIAMSDSYKNSVGTELSSATLLAPITGNNGTFSSIPQIVSAIESNLVDGGTSANAGGSGFVGIVPFEWLVGNGSPTSFTSISQQTARGLITNGFVPQSYLTGGSASADTANYFYLVGRNEDSGTRIGAFSESQFGLSANPKQYSINGVAGSTSTGLFPVTALNTEANIEWGSAGHSGYSSGGNVATALDVAGGSLTFANGQAPENSGSSYVLGYVGITDAATAVAGGARALSYDGVPFSVAAVQNGQYTFWTYEHSYHLSSLAGTKLTVANTIADNIYLSDADVASNGTHSTTSGATAAGILDNNNSPVLVYRPFTEGQPLSNY
jgi:hypothetical protein